MSLRFPTLLSAAALAAAPVAVIALPASAATCTAPEAYTEAGPRTVVVDTTGTEGFDVLVAVRANGCTVSGVTAVVTSPSKTSADLTLEAVETQGDVTLYAQSVTFTAANLGNDDAGTWRVKTSTTWAEQATADEPGDDDGDEADEPGDDDGDDGDEPGEPGDDHGDDTSARAGDDEPGDDEPGDDDSDEGITGSGKVQVVAASDLTADATSGSLKKGRIGKGKALTVKGTLTRADWEAGRAVGYAKQKVDLQFRTPKGSYKKVRTLKTGARGTFAESVKVKKDGCYRVVFAGSKTTAAAPSKAECIDVR